VEEDAERWKSGGDAAADHGDPVGRRGDPAQPSHMPFVVVGRHCARQHLHDLVAGISTRRNRRFRPRVAN